MTGPHLPTAMARSTSTYRHGLVHIYLPPWPINIYLPPRPGPHLPTATARSTFGLCTSGLSTCVYTTLGGIIQISPPKKTHFGHSIYLGGILNLMVTDSQGRGCCNEGFKRPDTMRTCVSMPHMSSGALRVRFCHHMSSSDGALPRQKRLNFRGV